MEKMKNNSVNMVSMGTINGNVRDWNSMEFDSMEFIPEEMVDWPINDAVRKTAFISDKSIDYSQNHVENIDWSILSEYQF